MKYEIMSKSKLSKAFSIQNLCQLFKAFSIQDLFQLQAFCPFLHIQGQDSLISFNPPRKVTDLSWPVSTHSPRILCWLSNRHRNRHHEKYLFSTVIIRKIEFISQKIGFLGYKVGYNLGGSLFGHSIFKSHIPSSLRHQGKPSNT